MVNQEIIASLKRYLLLLDAEGISVNKAFLYGSYLDGTATGESDIDVMIVSDGLDDNDDNIFGKAWRLTRKVNAKIEPYLISTQKFNNENSSPLIYQVKANGLEIV